MAGKTTLLKRKITVSTKLSKLFLPIDIAFATSIAALEGDKKSQMLFLIATTQYGFPPPPPSPNFELQAVCLYHLLRANTTIKCLRTYERTNHNQVALHELQTTTQANKSQCFKYVDLHDVASLTVASTAEFILN